jgi:putative iron-regulated protein
MNTKKSLLAIAAATMLLSACSKDTDPVDTTTTDFNTLKSEVLTNFTNNIAVAGYKDLSDASDKLYSSLEALNASATDANLIAARNSWKSMRTTWEQCEGFLFGPVEDNDYDPNMDTWPTDYVQMDSLLTSSNPLEVSDISSVTLSLRGYHPIEYIIFGNHGDRKAADITDRQKKYMINLATDLKNTCHALHTSWTQAPENFANEVIKAGNGSTKYAKKQEVYIALVDGMTGICEEVGEGKMKEPFDAKDPAIVESPYSGNSLIDFKNNIIGLQNVYLGKYTQDGKGLNDLVALKNKSLDNKIQAEMIAAINSFDNVNGYYEDAIINQRVQVQAIMTALGTLKETLDGELKPFVIQYITD